MPITSVKKDAHALTLTIVADFAAPAERVWNAYCDPRRLERFWGPPSWPATFTRHDFHPGGRSAYSMTGPEGEASHGYWEFLRVEPQVAFEVLDGFAHADGTPNTDMPTMRMVFEFEPTASGSRVTTTTFFDSAEQLDQLLEMGMEQGAREAMGQIDAVLADLRSFAAELPAMAQVLDDTTVRVSRVIGAPVQQVWTAHTDAELVSRWMLGPDGWSMPTCETATAVGQKHHYLWRNDEDGTSFASTGEVLEIEPPHRLVFTEEMRGDFIPDDAPATLNEMTLTAVGEGTLLTLVITYPDAATRDAVLGTGMVDGMETGYRRLEQVALGAG